MHAMHNASPRSREALYARRTAALPATLLEGILFRTVKEASPEATGQGFLNGRRRHPFLDEINCMPTELQAKLLQVLQDGCVRRIGDVGTIYVDVG